MVYVVPQQPGLRTGRTSTEHRLWFDGSTVTELNSSKIHRHEASSLEEAKQYCAQELLADPAAVFYIAGSDGTILETIFNREWHQRREERIERREPYIAAFIVLTFSALFSIMVYALGFTSPSIVLLFPATSILLWLVFSILPMFWRAGTHFGYGEAYPALSLSLLLLILYLVFNINRG